MSNFAATARPDTFNPAWGVLMAEYNTRFEAEAKALRGEVDDDQFGGTLSLKMRNLELRIGGYHRRDGKNSKIKGQYKPWQQR
jgi:hypothetical protein